MRKIFVGMMVLGGLAAAAGTADAQGFFPLAVEVRGGAGFPVGDFGDGLEMGWGFEGNAQLQVAPMIAIYAGYDRTEFQGSDDGALDLVDEKVTDQGFSLGGQLSLPTAMILGLSPFVRAGAIYHETKLDFENGSFDRESEKNIGYEVGGGVSIPLGLVVSFTPAVRYRSYAPEWDGGSEEDVSYVMADLGMKFSF